MSDGLKNDSEKPKLGLVPINDIWRAIARVREFGCKKYKDPDNWKNVDPERYRHALFRHIALYCDDPDSVDEESGLPHLYHAACNIAFLLYLENNNTNAK